MSQNQRPKPAPMTAWSHLELERLQRESVPDTIETTSQSLIEQQSEHNNNKPTGEERDNNKASQNWIQSSRRNSLDSQLSANLPDNQLGHERAATSARFNEKESSTDSLLRDHVHDFSLQDEVGFHDHNTEELIYALANSLLEVYGRCEEVYKEGIQNKVVEKTFGHSSACTSRSTINNTSNLSAAQLVTGSSDCLMAINHVVKTTCAYVDFIFSALQQLRRDKEKLQLTVNELRVLCYSDDTTAKHGKSVPQIIVPPPSSLDSAESPTHDARMEESKIEHKDATATSELQSLRAQNMALQKKIFHLNTKLETSSWGDTEMFKRVCQISARGATEIEKRRLRASQSRHSKSGRSFVRSATFRRGSKRQLLTRQTPESPTNVLKGKTPGKAPNDEMTTSAFWNTKDTKSDSSSVSSCEPYEEDDHTFIQTRQRSPELNSMKSELAKTKAHLKNLEGDYGRLQKKMLNEELRNKELLQANKTLKQEVHSLRTDTKANYFRELKDDLAKQKRICTELQTKYEVAFKEKEKIRRSEMYHTQAYDNAQSKINHLVKLIEEVFNYRVPDYYYHENPKLHVTQPKEVGKLLNELNQEKRKTKELTTKYEVSQVRFARATLKCSELKSCLARAESKPEGEDIKKQWNERGEVEETKDLSNDNSSEEGGEISSKVPKRLIAEAEDEDSSPRTNRRQVSVDFYKKKKQLKKPFSKEKLSSIITLDKLQKNKEYLRYASSKALGVLGQDLYSTSEILEHEIEQSKEKQEESVVRPATAERVGKPKNKSLTKRATRLPYNEILGHFERETSGAKLLEKAKQTDGGLSKDQWRLQKNSPQVCGIEEMNSPIYKEASYYDSIEASKARIKLKQDKVEKPTFRLKRSERKSQF